ncbi:hypothetical protein TUM4636_33740 [Shewanella glacialipiscicola]|nr:hypothetical protein TUM4636_33740 [Shewanella glacialipiscicola]
MKASLLLDKIESKAIKRYKINYEMPHKLKARAGVTHIFKGNSIAM